MYRQERGLAGNTFGGMKEIVAPQSHAVPAQLGPLAGAACVGAFPGCEKPEKTTLNVIPAR
jgi:hypothetical protein